MNFIEKANELPTISSEFFIATIDDSYPMEFDYDESVKWMASIGNGIDAFGPTIESCVEDVYAQAQELPKPCKTCLAETKQDEPLNGGECLNCYNTRTEGKAFFSVGLERTTEQLQRTAHIL